MLRYIPTLLLLFFLVLVGLLLSKFITIAKPILIIGLSFGWIIALITFFKPELSIVIIVFSMLLSPEIEVAQIPGRIVAIRVEDLLLILIFLAYLARISLRPKEKLLEETPINLALFFYTGIIMLSTIKGIIFGTVIPMRAFFFGLKYIEYFVLFFLVSALLKDKKLLDRCLTAAVITCIIVTIYAYTQAFQGIRATAPFEGGPKESEPASYGGYLLIVISILLGLYTYWADSTKRKFWLISFLGFLFIAFLYTQSRASYFGFIAGLIAFIFLVKRKKVLYISSIATAIVFLVYYFSTPTPLQKQSGFSSPLSTMRDRIMETFENPAGRVDVGLGEIPLEGSAYARVQAWKRIVFDDLPKYPFLGWGVTGRGLVDAQYPRVIGETGLIGFGVFIWLIFSIFKNSFKVLKIVKTNNLYRGIVTGYIVCLVSLLIQAITTNTFIIVRIMEPFWFLTAIVFNLPKIYKVVS